MTFRSLNKTITLHSQIHKYTLDRYSDIINQTYDSEGRPVLVVHNMRRRNVDGSWEQLIFTFDKVSGYLVNEEKNIYNYQQLVKSYYRNKGTNWVYVDKKYSPFTVSI